MKGIQAKQSAAGTIQSNQDQLYEINFTKNNNYFDFSFANNSQIEYGGGGVFFATNDVGHRKILKYMELRKIMSDSQFKNIKYAYSLQQTGTWLSAIGLGGGLGAQIARIFPSIGTQYTSEEEKAKEKKLGNNIGNYGAIIGGGLAVVGLPLWIIGNNNVKKSVEDYNHSLHQRNEHSLNLNIGITPDGGVGLALNF